MTRRSLALALLLVLAGCAAPVDDPEARGPWSWPEDPPTDRIGWEAGRWYNESISVNQSDGLDAAERRAFVARTMARVERIRNLEFRQSVPVEVVSRRAFRNESGEDGGSGNSTYATWNDVVWEAFLLVGEDREISAVFEEVYGGAVQGYYSPSKDEIVIVSDSKRPVIDRTTLAHELVHALQDQHFSLLGGARTQDRQLAEDGIVEGDAAYVEALYEDRCGSQWDCVPRPAPAGGGGGLDPRNIGVYLSIYFPYSDGPHFVHRVRQRGGWAAVNDVYDRPPASTEQVIHPGAYPEERPARINVPDRSGENWRRFDLKQRSDVAGEATIFTAFWFHRVVPRSHLTEETGVYSDYNYAHRISAGWNGDVVVPYRSGSGEFGYVWRLRWDTPRDARQFAEAYRTLLTRRLNATRVREGVYRVPDTNPYGDAFRVTREGTTVTIVNAPTPSQLSRVHADG